MLAHDCIAKFLDWQRAQVAAGEYESSTLRYYERQLGKLEELLPRDLDANDLKPYHLHAGPAAWHFHQATRRVFTWATRVGYLREDPLRNHKLPAAGERERVLSVGELTMLFETCDPAFRKFLWCLVRISARPIELRALRWHQVDLARRIITIHSYKGKRRRNGKSKAAARVIPFDAEVAEFLRAEHAARKPAPDDHVFTGRHGQPYTKDAVSRNFARAGRRIGLGLDANGERAVPYTLRHTALTYFTELDMPQKLVSDVGGHADSKTTQRYQHVRPDAKVEAVDRALATAKARDHGLSKLAPPGRKKSQQLRLFN